MTVVTTLRSKAGSLDRDGMIEMLGGWIDRYPIVAVEDPLAEDDPEGMARFAAAYGERVQIIGDDYLVTNADLVNAAAAAGMCNALLLKVNQAGTVSEALAAWRAASSQGWNTVVSARSGETEDTSIVHLAVGLGAGQLKVGSFARSERMAKWNECIRIEEAQAPRVPLRPLLAAAGDLVGRGRRQADAEVQRDGDNYRIRSGRARCSVLLPVVFRPRHTAAFHAAPGASGTFPTAFHIERIDSRRMRVIITQQVNNSIFIFAGCRF